MLVAVHIVQLKIKHLIQLTNRKKRYDYYYYEIIDF